MIARPKRYTSYEATDLPWLPCRPGHWRATRLRNLSSKPIANGVGESAQAFDPDLPRYIRITDIGGPTTLKETKQASLPSEIAASAKVEFGDLLLAAVGATYGKSYLHLQRGGRYCYAGFLVRVAPNLQLVDPLYLSYWTQSPHYWNQINANVIKSTIENFSAGRYKNLWVILPPLDEQAAIARYCAHLDANVSRLLRTKRRLIALLTEQKQAIIQHAVTRGLDPAAPLADSGVPWLGQVPAHWELVPMGKLLRLRKLTVGAAHPDYTLLSLTLKGIIPRDLENAKGKFPSDFGTYQVVEPGDLVLCLFDVDETPRTIGRANQIGMVTGAYTVARPTNDEMGEYLTLFLTAMDDQKRFRPLYKGLRKVIQKTTFLSIKVPFPPQNERREIIQLISTEIERINTTIDRITREIDLIREYRTRLVADVVTGQLDVRAAAASLPDLDLDPLADAGADGGDAGDSLDDDSDGDDPDAGFDGEDGGSDDGA